MRGEDHKQSAMFSYISLEQRIPLDHPVRRIRAMAPRPKNRAQMKAGGERGAERDELSRGVGQRARLERKRAAHHAAGRERR